MAIHTSLNMITGAISTLSLEGFAIKKLAGTDIQACGMFGGI